MPSEMKHGYVMMLDVLGFRDFVSKTSGSSFFDIWNSIKTSIIEQKKLIEDNLKQAVTIDVICLSDTLIVCVSLNEIDRIDDKYLLCFMPILIDTFFYKQIKNNQVFFRGAISYGKFTYSTEQNIIMGHALDEVSDWYESTDWIGIILSPSAEYALEKLVMEKESTDSLVEGMKKRFIEYDKIPFKKEITARCKYAYLWINNETDSKNKEKIIELLAIYSDLKHTVAIAAKYKNSLEFIKHFLIPIQ